MTTGIVTDSTSDIPHEEAERLGIQVVPAVVVLDGKALLEGVDITRSQMYEQIPNLARLPTTAAPSAGTFEEVYHQLFARGVSEIVSVHVSSKLSGIWNTARLAAENFSGRVHLFDSEQVSLGLGFQVLAAAEAAMRGANPAQILRLLDQLKPRSQVIAMIDRLENLRRSGRISWLRAELGSLLQIRLVVTVAEGTVRKLAEVRTRARGVLNLVEVARSWGVMERLAVLHVGAENDARAMFEHLAALPGMRTLFGGGTPWLVEATPVLGIHTGQGAVGLAGIRRA
jgi:fatty acid kinase fatty acid binding subunit